MKQKLAKFSAFAEGLFPHEVYFLSRIANFQSEENKKIFEVISHNLRFPNRQKPFDDRIDKRKYSNLKKWIEERLSEADVDQQLLAIQEIEAKVLLDQVDSQTEKEILHWLKKGTPTHYYFRKIYELAQHYEHFLLIRLRDKVGAQVSAYLNLYREDFEYSQEIFNTLQRATSDVISHYRNRGGEYLDWEKFLIKVVYNDQVDGMNQYAAFIRLSLYYLNKADADKLEGLYHFMDEKFKTGRFYSKRILSNFYANRLLFYSRTGDLEKAAYNGHLSLQFKNADYLFYLTNLGGVLLKQGKSLEAISLLKAAFPELRKTKSLHNRIGFVSFYLKCLVDLGRFKEAEEYADSYLQAYPKQVLEGRWHLFFAVYYRALILQEKYGRLLYLNSRYKIDALEKQNQQSPTYMPTISWYVCISRYMEEGGDAAKLIQEMKSALSVVGMSETRMKRIQQLYKDLIPIAPKVLKSAKSTILENAIII